MIQYFLKTSQFIPDGHYETIENIDFKVIYEQGIRLLLIDLDNTLIPYDESVPRESTKTLFQSLLKAQFEIVIISNNKASRLKEFCESLQIPYVSSAKKPLKTGFKKAINKASNSYQNNEICVIGDQLMTDVFGAKRLKLRVMLVRPIKKKSEKWYTRINRYIERKMLQKIHRKDPNNYRRLNLDQLNES